MEGLPKLPGYSFPNISRMRHGVPHQLDWCSGYMTVKKCKVGIGGEPLDVDGILFQKQTDPVSFDPSLVYGKANVYSPPAFKPHFVLYDKKCLTFKAFFKQSIYESPLENYRVRRVNIIYFLEDDTLTVMEPPTKNAGFPQGRLVTRGKIPRDNSGRYWHWKDFNVGMEMGIYGIVYHICSCDDYTREYLTSQGIEVGKNEDLPSDPYIDKRQAEQSRFNASTSKSFTDDKLFRYLEYDRKILRFDAIWDDESEYGEKNPYKIHYFLIDDTIEVSADSRTNSGRDPFVLLMKRMKVPKKWDKMPAHFAGCYLDRKDEDIEEFYGVEDFVVGATVLMLGRKFIITGCDPFTRKYYSECLGIEQPPSLPAPLEGEKETLKVEIPAYRGWGTVEDSLQSWYHFDPKPPPFDLIRYLENQSKKLRYTAVLDWVHPEDKERKFLIEYNLSDSTIGVHELPSRNSGFIAGKFLKPYLVPKAGTNPDNPEYITPLDFRLDGILNIFGHRFVITGGDLAVYRYMEANPDKFPTDQLCEMRNYLVKEGYLNEDIKKVADFRKREEVEEPVDVAEVAPHDILQDIQHQPS